VHPPAPTIRPARPDESAQLTALAVRSKAHWGYDDAFMRAALPELTIAPDLIARATVNVAERAGDLVGVYVLSLEDGGPTLRDLWVNPPAIGTGVGSALWRHMLLEARRLGYAAVRIESDPNAEAFYVRKGARRVGVVLSTVVAGRELPLMTVDVPGAPG
jgi:GNAT superfamily N-acetyltransferase